MDDPRYPRGLSTQETKDRLENLNKIICSVCGETIISCRDIQTEENGIVRHLCGEEGKREKTGENLSKIYSDDEIQTIMDIFLLDLVSRASKFYCDVCGDKFSLGTIHKLVFKDMGPGHGLCVEYNIVCNRGHKSHAEQNIYDLDIREALRGRQYPSGKDFSQRSK